MYANIHMYMASLTFRYKVLNAHAIRSHSVSTLGAPSHQPLARVYTVHPSLTGPHDPRCLLCHTRSLLAFLAARFHTNLLVSEPAVKGFYGSSALRPWVSAHTRFNVLWGQPKIHPGFMPCCPCAYLGKLIFYARSFKSQHGFCSVSMGRELREW